MAGQDVGVPADRLHADRAEDLVDHAGLVGEDLGEDQRDGDRGHHVGQQHTHPPERLGADVLVQDGGDRDRQDHLRHRGEQEDRERVAQRRQEPRLGQHVDVVLQTDERALARDEAPVVDRDEGRVGQREEPDDEEQDEERRDEQVRRELHVELADTRSRLTASRTATRAR